MTYRKKLTEVQAMQVHEHNEEAIKAFVGNALDFVCHLQGKTHFIGVNTQHGLQSAYVGEWIVKDKYGFYDRMIAEKFTEIYEEVVE